MLQPEGDARATDDDTVDPKELTATTVNVPPDGLYKMELLISVKVHEFNGWVLLLDWKETFI